MLPTAPGGVTGRRWEAARGWPGGSAAGAGLRLRASPLGGTLIPAPLRTAARTSVLGSVCRVCSGALVCGDSYSNSINARFGPSLGSVCSLRAS